MVQIFETPLRATVVERLDSRRRNLRRTLEKVVGRADLEAGSTDTVPEIIQDHMRNFWRINRASRYTQTPP